MTLIALRPLDPEGDLALLHGWMQQPHVAPWWALDGPVERVVEHLRAQPHVESWIGIEDGGPFAYVETYNVADDPLHAHYPARPGDRGFHLLVGPPELLGSGAARRLVRHVLALLLADEEATRVVCEPDVRNLRMLAFCRGLGAERIDSFDFDGRRVALFAWTQPAPVAA
jgi:acetyl CoA:N6-hydroxylysine acetyl transferase